MADRSVTDTDDNLKSLVKVLRILECFSTTDRALSLAEIRTATGLPKSTAHRLLASMREVGFLDQDRQRDRYRLGLKLFELGNVVLANMELHREARPLMDALGRLSGQTVHLAVFDGRQAVVIHRATPAPGAATPLVFLEAAPAHCTSVGKAVLAFQPPEGIERLIAGGLELGHHLKGYAGVMAGDVGFQIGCDRAMQRGRPVALGALGAHGVGT